MTTMFSAFERSKGDSKNPLVKRVVASMVRHVRQQEARTRAKKAKRATPAPKQ